MIAAASASTPVAWLVARAAGLVAFGLLTSAVLLGLAMSTRLLGTKQTKQLLAWHQTIVWTAVAMVLLHMGALLLDPVMQFRVVDVLVPGLAWPSPASSGAAAAGHACCLRSRGKMNGCRTMAISC